MKRKFLLVGVAATLCMPLSAIVACSEVITEGTIAFNKKENRIFFNLNTSSDNMFKPILIKSKNSKFELTNNALIKLNEEIQNCLTKNNVQKTNIGETMKVKMSYEFEKEIPDKDYASGKRIKKVREFLEVSFKLKKLSTNSKLLKKPFLFSNNIVLETFNELSKDNRVSLETPINEKNLLSGNGFLISFK